MSESVCGREGGRVRVFVGRRGRERERSHTKNKKVQQYTDRRRYHYKWTDVTTDRLTH